MDQQSCSNKAVYSQCQDYNDQDWNIFDDDQIERHEPTSSQIELYDSYKFGFVMTDFMNLLNKKLYQNKKNSFEILNEKYGPVQYDYYCLSERSIPIFNSSYQMNQEFYQQNPFEYQQQRSQERSNINWQTAKILFNQFTRRINYIKKMNLQAAFDNIQIHSLKSKYQQNQIQVQIQQQVQLSVSLDSQNLSFYVQQIFQSQFDIDQYNNQMIQFQQKIDQQLQELKQSQIRTEPFTPKSPPISLKSYHKKRKNKQKLLQKMDVYSNTDNHKNQQDDDDSFCLSDREQSQLYCFDLQSIFNTNQKQQYKTEPTTQLQFKTQFSYANQSSDSCSNLSPFSCFGRTNQNYSPIQSKKIQSCRFYNERAYAKVCQNNNTLNLNQNNFQKEQEKIEMIECQNQDKTSFNFKQDAPHNNLPQILKKQVQNNKKSIFMMDDQLFFTN